MRCAERRQHRRDGQHRRADPNPALRPPDVLRDPARQRLAEARREPGAHPRVSPTRTGFGSTNPLCSTTPFDQSSSKFFVKAARELRRLDDRDHVLLARPRVVRPVRRARPDGLAVAHHVLVVHQVGDAGDRPLRHAERGDELDVRLRRRRHRDRVAVPDVVDHPHRDPARGASLIAPPTTAAVSGGEVEVVVGEVERLLRAAPRNSADLAWPRRRPSDRRP